jgi:broad specificity phosphatase PhoE
LSCILAGNVSAQNREFAWSELIQGRAVAIIRHATAPGLGDPPGFQIGDCSTQRNLSEEGRIQARRIGLFFKHKGIKEATVYSSQWCRCLETARLLSIGPVIELPALNSFFQDSSTGQQQSEETRRLINTLPAGKTVIFVTHQVNITALTGIFPSPGEVIIFQLRKNGQGKVIGRVTP